MKKYFLIFAAALVAFAACQKPDEGNDDGKDKDKDKPVVVDDAITLASEAIVNAEAESSIVTIKFNASNAWTAEASADFIVLNKKAGEAGDSEVKATIQSLPEEEEGRDAEVTIKVGKVSAKVTINQGKVFYFVADYEPYLGVSGGEYTFKVITNLEYTEKIYDSFTWAPATLDKATGVGKFTVAPNAGYDARSAYIKFTIPAFQDPVIDDETGEPTGETQDRVVRFYVYQDGNSKVEWQTILDESFNVGEGATASLAMFNGKLLLCDAAKIYEVDQATGKLKEFMTGEEEFGIQSITSDDAGNLLLATLGAYGALFDVVAYKADDAELANPKYLIHCVVEAWSGSTGVDKVAARGDVFGDGVVTAMYGGVLSYDGVHYGLYWAINGGKAKEQEYNEWNPIVNQPDGGWFQLPLGSDDIWLSNRAAFIPAGPSVSDGFFYGGYDGAYNLNYYNGTEWIVAAEALGDWAGGPQGMRATTWNGKKVLAVMTMGYVWWGEGWGMPSCMRILDVTDPANVSVISEANYDPAEQIISGGTEDSTVDALPIVDGKDLVVFVVDTSHGNIVKLRFPAL